MMGCQERFCFLVVIFVCSSVIFTQSKSSEPSFREFPKDVFARNVKYSRHQPFCVVIRKSEDCGSGLEKSVFKVLKGEKQENYTDWEFGAISIQKVENQDSRPAHLPALRCYLGQTSVYDYYGNKSRQNIQKWLRKMTEQHAENSEDVTMETVAESRQHYNILLLLFPSGPMHVTVEDMVYKLASEFKSCKALPVHYYSSGIRQLKETYGVTREPSVVVIHTKGGAKNQDEIKLYEKAHVTYEVLHVYLTVKQMGVPLLNEKTFVRNFERQETVEWQFKPVLLCYYAYWADDVYAHLEAFKISMLKFNKTGARIRFGLLDLLERDIKRVAYKYTGTNFMTKIPFTILYDRDDNKVVSKYYISNKRPYPWQLYQDLKQKDLVNLVQLREIKEPWGYTPPTQVTMTTEGPYGYLCTTWSHNMTDSVPVQLVKQQKHTKKIVPVKKKKTKDMHNIFATETVDKRLKKLEGIPRITKSLWAEVIEKSHTPQHLYYKSGKWAGEITKVALVVFIMADCGSCKNNMETFKQLQKSVSYIDGGIMYIVNCTAEPELCKNHNIKGYPTITAFRGHGWIGVSSCLSQKSQKIFPNFVRLDYHGVILNGPIMDWFADAASDAVQDVKLQKLEDQFQDKDVRIVGYLTPKTSRFLRRLPKSSQYLMYECLRLVCERLYGVVDCYTIYSPQIPTREFNEENLDMVVTDVILERRDGVKATVMRVGEALMETVAHQSDSGIHHFHRPHRYDLHPKQKCEADHATCTDFIIDFVLDHSRMPVTPVTSAMLHTTSSLLKEEDLPVMVVLVEPENISNNCTLMKELTAVAYELYKDIIIMTLDVTRFSAWASSFVPVNYGRLRVMDQNDPDPYRMFLYPRICIIKKHDHRRAAFYPPIKRHNSKSYPFTQDAIIKFARDYLENPEKMLLSSEQF